MYNQNIFGSSAIENLIFGNFRKMFGSVPVTVVEILENPRKYSVVGSGRKSSENRQKRCYQCASQYVPIAY